MKELIQVYSLGSKTSLPHDNIRSRLCGVGYTCNKSSALMFRVIVASWASRGAFGRGRFHRGALKGEVSHQLSHPKSVSV